MSREGMHCFLERQGQAWAAYCVEVNVSATGASAEEAKGALNQRLERFWYDYDAGDQAARQLRRRSLGRQLRYWAAYLRRCPDGQRSCYVFRSPPEMLLGLA